MAELTREQEAQIAELAIDHHSVGVEPCADGTAKVTAGGRVWRLGIDGNLVVEQPDRVAFSLPLPLVRTILGAEVVDKALKQVEHYQYPDHGLGQVLGSELEAAIIALVMDVGSRR